MLIIRPWFIYSMLAFTVLLALKLDGILARVYDLSYYQVFIPLHTLDIVLAATFLSIIMDGQGRDIEPVDVIGFIGLSIFFAANAYSKYYFSISHQLTLLRYYLADTLTSIFDKQQGSFYVYFSIWLCIPCCAFFIFCTYLLYPAFVAVQRTEKDVKTQ